LNPEHRPLQSLILLILAGAFCAFAGERQHCAGLDSFTIKECGPFTLCECVKKIPSCGIAQRLNSFAVWIDSIQSDKPCSSRVAALAERYASFNDTVLHKFDLSSVPFVGTPASPVTILLFVSTTCPLCKKVYKELYSEVTEGKLKDRAKIGIKVFSARPADIALLAAKKFNKQSEFLLSLAGVEERISMKIVIQKAVEIGIPEREFRALLQDSVLMREAEASALEGESNGVTVTPTAFINNKRYRSYKDPKWIVDAALYEYELLARGKTGESHR
jgi:protein-disulfide isomerase